ncbi:MAG: DUF554 domain-containing protein [Microbacteriaceae bacterium]|nr:DUF554 domain-containing protein [Microbacteriaceae bacterium]
MIGLGTIVNVVAIVIGGSLGVLVGHRLPERTSRVVTDSLGLVVLVIGAMNVMSLTDESFVGAVGPGVGLLVVVGALVVGGVVGSLLDIETRLEKFGIWLQAFARSRGREETGSSSARNGARGSRFVEGFVDASLIYCVGPMAILGALSDGTGHGIETLALKASLDGISAIAFAAALGWGVAFSAVPVGLWQGLLTLLAVGLGTFMSSAVIASITVTGGILMLGIGLRVLNIRQINVGNLLPALIVAPLITIALAAIRGTL